MIYKNYEAQISYSEEDEIFVGRVINIEDDIIAFDGNSIVELKQAFQAVIEEYLDDCIKANRQPQKPLEKATA